ncbi:MAG: hypothetical protein JF615_12775 [Asticcacaulis sp.]|nr:hypothetical protein [Asticcacaulis sp.]
MTQSRWPFVVSVLLMAATGGLLGGFNMHWGRQTVFPLYGILIDILAVPVLVYMILYVRRMKAAISDEFSVAKKRFAAQTGFVVGFALFAITGLVPLIFQAPYHAFIASLDGANEAFIMGRVFGMAPFVFGLLIGQIAAWARYR